MLRELLREYRSPRLPEMPPFTGGLVGSFSYEMIGYAEPVLKLPENEGNDFDLMLFDKVIAYDHLRQKIAIVVNMKTDRVLENYGRAVEEIDRIARLIAGPVSLPPLSGEHAASPAFVSEMDEQRYGALVERAKEYIRAGDIFQVVLSRRFDTLYKDSLLNAYRWLRTTNPVPVYGVFAGGRYPANGVLAGDAGEASGRGAEQLPTGRIPVPVAGMRRPTGRWRRNSCRTKRSSVSTTCWWIWPATMWDG